MEDIKIRQARGGYVITLCDGEEVVAFSLEGVFDYLLQYFEGLSSSFTGTLHGEVIVKRGA